VRYTAQLHGHQNPICYLNGQRQFNVIWADPDAGELERCLLKNGKAFARGNKLATEVVRGTVRVIFPERLAS
jgi:hypothetical protein